MRKHAKLSPSGSHRWMGCPGSIKLCEKVPKAKSTAYADEGTAAHVLCEKLLKGEDNFSVGMSIVYDEDTGAEWVIDQEMLDSAMTYVNCIRDNLLGTDSSQMYIEQRFDLSWLYPKVFGSNDCCVYDPVEKHLHVVDFKYGKGIKVDPEWNPQLMIYALGAVEFIWKKECKRLKKELVVRDAVKTLTLSIVQPRILEDESNGISTWDITTESLFFWGLNVFRPAALATESKDAALCVGEHCRFCNAMAVCPEQARVALQVAKTDFDNPVLPDPEDLTSEEIIKVMEVSSIIAKWSKEVASYAHMRMESGQSFPGFKLVRRKSNRKWSNEEDALEVLTDILDEGAYTRKLLSVAQAEKMLKVEKLSPLTISHLWHKPDTGTTIAVESDKRKEVMPSIEEDYGMDFLQ